MKILLFFVIAAVAINDAQSAMTEAQVKAAGKLLRNLCQPKTKVTNAQIDALHKGEFGDNRDMMCYMECILRSGQILKDGKLNVESVRTQITNLPANLSPGGLITLENCKDSMKSSDKCLAGFEFYKCFYEDNPANFFLP